MKPFSPSLRELVRKAESHEHFPLSALQAINAVRRHLRELEFAAMSTARAKGASWTEIARASGVSRQAVQRRFTSLTSARDAGGPAGNPHRAETESGRAPTHGSPHGSPTDGKGKLTET
jgi:hypothetical protein